MKKILLSLSVIAAMVFYSCKSGSENSALRTVDASAFRQLVDAHGSTVLDVRHADEFAEDHIEGAVNIDVEDPSFGQNIQSLDKSKTYLVYCRAGRRSMNAAQQMTAAGFTDVVNLDGGLTSWKEQGFPVSK
jgi:rhodanese-related sulfurtransferase